MRIRDIAWMFTLFCMSQILMAVEPLGKDDYCGAWSSNISLVNGENQSLAIEPDHSASFTRSFADKPKQLFTTDAA